MISKNLINQVAKISRIDLTEEETEKFTNQIKDVLEAFKTIEKTDTKNVEPSFQPLEIKNIWRQDKPKKWDWNPLSNTKNKEKNHFKGPRSV